MAGMYEGSRTLESQNSDRENFFSIPYVVKIVLYRWLSESRTIYNFVFVIVSTTGYTS